MSAYADVQPTKVRGRVGRDVKDHPVLCRQPWLNGLADNEAPFDSPCLSRGFELAAVARLQGKVVRREIRCRVLKILDLHVGDDQHALSFGCWRLARRESVVWSEVRKSDFPAPQGGGLTYPGEFRLAGRRASRWCI